MSTLRRFLTQFQAQFNNMAPAARLQLVVIPLAVVLGLGLLMVYQGGPPEEAVLSGKSFSSDEMKQAEETLRQAGLHQFRADGQKILVPQNDLSRYNAVLQTDNGSRPDNFGKVYDKALDTNLLTAGTGAQRGDRMDLARAQSLARSIKRISYIEDAEVVWFRAPGSGSRGVSRMTALLTVKPRAGTELTSQQAEALRQAVASGFGMQASDVTVLDSNSGRTSQFAEPQEPAPSRYLQSVREYTNHYQELIAESLKDIPHVLVSVTADFGGQTGRPDHPAPTADASSTGGRQLPMDRGALAPSSVQATVSIPKDYYRDLLTRRKGAKLGAAAFQSRLRKVQSDTEKEIVQRVARLLPAANDKQSGDAVIIQSYERIEPADTATSAAPEMSLGKALIDWGGPIGLALIVLWLAARFIRNSNRATPHIADAASTIITKTVSTGPLPKLEDPEHNRRPPTRVPRLDVVTDEGSGSPVAELPASASLFEMDGPTPNTAPFGFLHRLSPDRLVPLIVEEHPQTMALILSNLPAAVSAAVLTRLPADKQMDVMRRIATIEQASPEILREVEQGIQARLRSSVIPPHEQTGGISALAQMLTTSTGSRNRAILENLEQESPELAAQIRRRMFHFEDLMQLDSRAFQELLKEIELVQWALALKGASTELQTRVLESLSWRDSNLLLEEIQYLGPVRVSDIEVAQRLIVDAVVRGATAAGHRTAVSDPNLLFA